MMLDNKAGGRRRWRGLTVLALAVLLSASPARAGRQYAIDPRFGSIEFSVRHLGLFSSQG